MHHAGHSAPRSRALLLPPYAAPVPATDADVAGAPLGALELVRLAPDADLLSRVAVSPRAPWVPLVLVREGGRLPAGGALVRTAHRWVTLLSWPAHRPFDPAACVAHVRTRAAPEVEDVVEYIWQRTGSAPLAASLRELASTPPGDAPATASLSRRLRRLGVTLGASDWRRVMRLTRLERRGTDRVDDLAVRAGIDARTLRRWVTELLGVPPTALGELAGWPWIAEAVLRRTWGAGAGRAARAG